MTNNQPSKNAELLADFVAYCEANPELRFWQVLRNWSGYGFVLVKNDTETPQDTYYWEGRTNE